MGGGSINKVVMDGFIKHRFQALQSPARNDMHYEACITLNKKPSFYSKNMYFCKKNIEPCINTNSSYF
jgi:hypothetical protein